MKLQCKSLSFASIVHYFSVLLLLVNRTLIYLLLISTENSGFTSMNRKMSRHDEKNAGFCCFRDHHRADYTLLLLIGNPER